MKKNTANLINLHGYSYLESIKSDRYRIRVKIKVRSLLGACSCGKKTRIVYESKIRKVKHCFWDKRACILFIKQRRFKCRQCKSRFWEALPGITKYSRRTERFKEQIANSALNGHDNKLTAKNFNIGEATVQRDVNHLTILEVKKKSNLICPLVIGIDEHFFTKKKGYATTIGDLDRKKIFDIRLGRSEKSLASYLLRLKNKERAKIIVMDLSTTYRSIAKKYFPKAQIVTDRFHVIRLLNQRFLEAWKALDPRGKQNRGLLSLFRRKPENLKPGQATRLRAYLKSKPVIETLYDLRNNIHELLSKRGQKDEWQMKQAIKEYSEILTSLNESGLKPLRSLAKTFKSWEEEILRMLRFNRSNGLVEGYHNKMERVSRQAYGFRNFNNYRQRVLLKCA